MKTGIITTAKIGVIALGMFALFGGNASAAYFDYASAPRCDVQITRTLQIGSEGIEVTVLQNFLNRTGDLSAVPTGYFGVATASAIRAFQSDNGIYANGIVGETTRNAINERMCDTDLRTDSYYDAHSQYSYSGYSTGVTYVDAYDPFVQVISPFNSSSVVYTTPQNFDYSSNYTTYGSSVVSNSIINPSITTSLPSSITGIASTNIVYSPSIGYTYGITPAIGALTISTPIVNTVYQEGDTVYLAWTTNNINATGYAILLENSSTGQSRTVTNVSGTSASFPLTKDVLDAVCGGGCSNDQQRNFRIVITTPIRDIAGNVTTFRAAVSPITIKRQNANFGTVSITASKTPVTTGEIFKLYVNIPTGASWDANLYGQYSFKIRALCPAGVTVSIAGASCGQDFTIPYAPTYFQSEIPAAITNTSWYQQDVTFVMTVTNLTGQQIGTAQTNVKVHHAPFNW